MAGLWVTVRDLGPNYESSDYAQDAVKAASYLMWTLSGRRYSGITTVTERYVRFAPLINTRLLQEAAIINSRVNKALQIVEPWVSAETRIRLRGQPVSEIHTVRNVGAGEIVNADSYYIVDKSAIQFSEGALIVPADIELTYTYGTQPPLLGRMAAKRVAIEFIKLWEDDETCALPQRVTSVTRQGVTYTVLDSQDFLQEMRLGIYEIDLFLKANNPNKAQKRAKVFSPDISKARAYTRKPSVYPANATTDFVLAKSGTTTKTILLADIDAQFLYAELGWDAELILRSHERSRAITVSNVTVNATQVILSATYEQAFGALKMVDPGSWDLYATKNGETVHVASGNLSIDLVS